jgi:hypothetical protein
MGKETAAGSNRPPTVGYRARVRRGGLLYVTDKRSAYFEVRDEDLEIALADLRALSLIRFLDRVWSAQDALSVLPIDWDDYRATPAARTAVENLLAASEHVMPTGAMTVKDVNQPKAGKKKGHDQNS